MIYGSSPLQKLEASLVNVGLVLSGAAVVYPAINDTRTWKIVTVIMFFAYTWAFRVRCIGMRLVKTFIEPPTTLPYAVAYTVGFSTFLYWVWFPFDLLLANGIVQAISLRLLGNTLHGWLTGNKTMTTDEYIERIKLRAMAQANDGQLMKAVALLHSDMDKADMFIDERIRLYGLRAATAGDLSSVRKYIASF